MNGHWNPYSAYNANGTPRDRGHSTKNFRRAWQRIVLIVRGGTAGWSEPRRCITPGWTSNYSKLAER